MAQQGIAWLPMVLWAVLVPCSAWLTPRISFPEGQWMVNVTVKCGFYLFRQYTVMLADMYISQVYVFITY